MYELVLPYYLLKPNPNVILAYEPLWSAASELVLPDLLLKSNPNAEV